MCGVFLNRANPAQEVVSLVQKNLDFILSLNLSINSYYFMAEYLLHIQPHDVKAMWSFPVIMLSAKISNIQHVTIKMDSNTVKRPDRIFVLKSIDWNWNYYDNY